MNRKIRRMMREIERRGGKLYVNPELPDDMTEEFLAEVLACPDCAAPEDLAGFAAGTDSFDLPALLPFDRRPDRSGH